VADDAEVLAEVMIAALRGAFQGIVPDHILEWPDSVTNWRRGFAEGFGDGVFLDVALADDGMVVGYVMGGLSGDAAYQGEVISLMVLPTYQGKGVGGMLVRHVAKRLAERGIHSLCVKVIRSNPNRIFYERLGGQYVSEHPYDWDGVLMPECLYGWKDTRGLVEEDSDIRRRV
jgi:ribosomal protein S18 acetylase RimI-like enzyme